MGDEHSACSLLENMLHNPNAEPTDLPLSVFKSITNNFSDEQKVGGGGLQGKVTITSILICTVTKRCLMTLFYFIFTL
jgi:hypothetical protein